jgi:hypothetical protein
MSNINTVAAQSTSTTDTHNAPSLATASMVDDHAVATSNEIGAPALRKSKKEKTGNVITNEAIKKVKNAKGQEATRTCCCEKVEAAIKEARRCEVRQETEGAQVTEESRNT